jgi:hypothetical protein
MSSSAATHPAAALRPVSADQAARRTGLAETGPAMLALVGRQGQPVGSGPAAGLVNLASFAGAPARVDVGPVLVLARGVL